VNLRVARSCTLISDTATVVISAIDIAGLLTSVILMVSVIVAVAERWPSFWWLLVPLALLPVFLVSSTVLAVMVSREDEHTRFLSRRSFKRAALYLLPSSVANVIINIVIFLLVFTFLLSR
jgi:uncharacterized membrane protein